MTREEHLDFCKICINQKFSMSQGVICRLTNKMADFQGTCNMFSEDIDLISRFERKEIGAGGTSASSGRRFVNMIIDLVSAAILSIVFKIMLAFISLSFITLLDDYNWPGTMLSLIILFFYYSVFEMLTGRTIGKYITKTKVVDENGKKPGYKTILLRNLVRLIPFDALSFLSSDNFNWHDKLSKTRVIDA